MPLSGVRLLAAVASGLTLLALLAGCADDQVPAGADPALVDSTQVPDQGSCRNLRRADLGEPSNASTLVECVDPHNAETFAAGTLPDDLHGLERLDPALDQWAYRTCSAELRNHLGADESVVMRSILTWVWFRPSEQAWEDGARWYRCDVVGGGPQSASLLDLPASTAGMLQGQPDDRWMVCAKGDTFDAARRLPCSQQHDWRAVTTIKLGVPEATYPGDRQVQVTTRDFCSDSVDAWLRYPADFDFGYTWFGEAEWEAGNRRSVCWARTDT